LGNGAISYAATCAYGSTASGFAYPTNPDGGPGNRYLAGTFRYSKPSGAVTTMVGTAEARERRFALTVPQQPMSLGTYPNPATSSFVLNVNNGYLGSMLVQFVGSNGVVYKTLQINKTQTGFQRFTISTAGLQKGRYAVTVSGGGVRQTTTLIKL
ncbi:MAG TPA: T9SS type A sorting domain-containing protein, partial [Flavisolibacter sp.]|nr:T9SS type A sorting domain-containing protein [Flavisolibacter sp.]